MCQNHPKHIMHFTSFNLCQKFTEAGITVLYIFELRKVELFGLDTQLDSSSAIWAQTHT